MNEVFIFQMVDNLYAYKSRLIKLLSAESGYFGWVRMWWDGAHKYEFIGFTLSIDIEPMLREMTQEQGYVLGRIASYFEMHAHPLKDLLRPNDDDLLFRYYAEVAWSHFMTVVMFGMLEVAIKGTQWAILNKNGNLKKAESIKYFLEENLSTDLKADITRRYSASAEEHPKHFNSFEEVVAHLWDEIRSGFVHEAGFESKGLEWTKLHGLGTKDDPISFTQDVPTPEWLQVAWQAIFNSYGYSGTLIRESAPAKSFEEKDNG